MRAVSDRAAVCATRHEYRYRDINLILSIIAAFTDFYDYHQTSNTN